MSIEKIQHWLENQPDSGTTVGSNAQSSNESSSSLSSSLKSILSTGNSDGSKKVFVLLIMQILKRV